MPHNTTPAAIDAALSAVESTLHLHHGSATLDEDGESFSPLDLAQSIAELRRARDLLGVTSCPPCAVTPAREVLGAFWPTRDLSKFADSAPSESADPNAP